jgi:outer membrane biosynthesis protein TonB
MEPEKQSWWPELVEAAETSSLLQLSKRFDVNLVDLVQAMNRTGVKRGEKPAGEKKSSAATVAKRLAAPPKPKKEAPEPPPEPKPEPLPEEQPWWPKMLEVAGGRSLKELSQEFGVDPFALVAAFKRTGIDRTKLPKPPVAAAEPEAAAQPEVAAEAEAPKRAPQRRIVREEPKKEAKTKAAPAKAPTPKRTARGRRKSKGIDPLLSHIVKLLAEADSGVAAGTLTEGVAADHQKVRRLLKQLESAGITYRTGKARGTRWYLG